MFDFLLRNSNYFNFYYKTKNVYLLLSFIPFYQK